MVEGATHSQPIPGNGPLNLFPTEDVCSVNIKPVVVVVVVWGLNVVVFMLYLMCGGFEEGFQSASVVSASHRAHDVHFDSLLVYVCLTNK